MIVEQLKKSILQQAFQGKITEQNLNDSNVNETIKKINEIKDNNIKIKKYKKTPVGKPITSENITYEIPSNWSWVRFIDICSVMTCGYASTPQYVEVGMPFLSAKNVKPFNFKPQEYKKISVELYNKLTTTCKPEKNDILLTRVGAGIGESAIIDVDMDFAIYVSLSLIKLVDYNLINNKYILYWLNSPYGISTSLNNITGKDSSQGNLNVDNVRNFLIPFPPIEEQKRIVDKLDEIFKLLEEIEPIEDSLNVLKKNFVIDMKKSVFNEILSKYENFINLGKISVINGGYAFKSSNYCSEGIRVIRISDFDENGIKDDNIVRYKYDISLSPYKLDNDDIIICMTGGTVGKNIILNNIPDDYYTNQRVATIKVNKNYIPKYVYYCINAPYIQQMIQNSKNSTNDNISMPLIKSFPIPNISIEEQNNVIKQIEQFLPLLEEINCLVNEV